MLIRVQLRLPSAAQAQTKLHTRAYLTSWLDKLRTIEAENP